MKNQAILIKSTTGNAIIISLVIIVLLGVLTATLMRGSNRVTNNYSTEQINVSVAKLLRAAQDIESGIFKLTSTNGCSENEIDFTNTKTTIDYAHIPVSPDNRCKLYEVEGAGLTYSAPVAALLDISQSASADYGEWVFTGGQCVLKIGTGDTSPCAAPNLELMLIVKYINQDACLAINNLLKIPNAATADLIPTAASDTTATGFVGTFAVGTPTEIGDGGTGVTLMKQSIGCFKDSSIVGTYTFYYVVLGR